MEKFNESLPFDRRMWAEDIRVRRRLQLGFGLLKQLHSLPRLSTRTAPACCWGTAHLQWRAKQAAPHYTLATPLLICRAARRMLRLWPRRVC